jgi:hypothetical protein
MSRNAASLFVLSTSFTTGRLNGTALSVNKVQSQHSVCSRRFPGRPAAHIYNMENMVFKEEAVPPIPDEKFGDRFMSVFLSNLGKFWTWNLHILDSFRRTAIYV